MMFGTTTGADGSLPEVSDMINSMVDLASYFFYGKTLPDLISPNNSRFICEDHSISSINALVCS